MKNRWFLFFFRKSVSQRKGRVVIASAAVMLAVAIVSAMISVTYGIREKLGAELKAYGANVIVSAADAGGLDARLLQRIAAVPAVEEVTGQVLGRVLLNGRQVELIGMDMEKVRAMGWRLSGRWPERPQEALAGTSLKVALGLNEGATVNPSLEGRTEALALSGFVEKGGAEDRALIVTPDQAWALAGGKGRYQTLLIRGRAGMLDRIASEIRQIAPDAEVRTVRQVAMAEEALLSKIQLLMGLVTIVVLLATTISVASTMGANVLERREEIGLMKALGATRKSISGFYLAEAALVGAAGGFTGLLLGFASAQAVSKGAFNSFIGIPFFLPFFAVLMGVALALLSSYFPVRNAMKYDPAVILRGE